MSLANELDEFFEVGNEVLVQEPLKFKAMLGIGERAYGLLRTREHMSTFSEAIGVGATASSVAASGAVASTFFASSGFMASTLSTIGIGFTAATPIGWVIAAGVISGGAYVGVTRMFEKSKDTGLVIVPKYINTPLDVIAVALIELMLPVSLKMAHTGGGMTSAERKAIEAYFADSWGYSSGFVSRLVEEYQEQLDSVSYERLAESLGVYCADSKDCDKEAIMSGFVTHLREVIEADGVVDADEQEQLDYMTGLLISEAQSAGAGAVVTDALSNAARGISTGTDYFISTGSLALKNSKKLLQEASESDTAKVLLTEASQMAAMTGEAASSGLKEGKRVASEAGEFAASKAKSLWNRLKPKDEDKPT
ncbi:hypothetical protein EYC98_21325 [Halieaceae bacterium IMCC14734]|uniref:Co-chaperone DjlA N-terminal domain-containing protein n=1 Tax=Candidatus Litorirhabdus singularis TaxID=2518993 RepID=A0ABT3TM47_9GAMM|nr:TerB family tellurite resistance protein [Candidatus Litorirhabdus singularis]MCX2983409.1 hypothetical protein [Candidatus Litorirhabdus singularis]